MRRYDFPIAPVVLGVILGPLMELQLRRTLLVSDGDWTALVERPFAASVLVVAALSLLAPVALAVLSRRSGERISFAEED